LLFVFSLFFGARFDLAAVGWWGESGILIGLIALDCVEGDSIKIVDGGLDGGGGGA
jgi:hypothetical protein